MAIFLQVALYSWPLLAYTLSNIEMPTQTGGLILLSMMVTNFIFSVLIFGAVALLGTPILHLVIALLFVGNGIAMHFMWRYGVFLDLSMIGNIFNTRAEEAGGYLSVQLLLDVVLLGILPAAWLAMQKVRPYRWLKRVLIAPMALVVFVAWAYATGSTWPWIDQHSKQIGGLMLPWNYVGNIGRYVAAKRSETPPQPLPDGEFSADAHQSTLVVLVIGESARSDNFSEYGYARETQPYTSTIGFVALPTPQSCTTYTTASIACMLSHQGDAASPFERFEPLQNYLSRMGVEVTWRANNWGEPTSAVDVYETGSDILAKCAQNCPPAGMDEVLVYGLSDIADASNQQRQFVVLHQTGSHGPSYFKKYPDRFSVFEPVCESVQLDTCDRESLINAYDNSIVYTDYVLSEVVKALESAANRPVAVLYVSDHGESLGESGVYLHGTTNVMAPDVQRNIPFLVWTNEAFKSAKRIKSKWLRSEAEVNQNLVFHSVVGAFDLQTPVYNPDLDLFEDVESAE